MLPCCVVLTGVPLSPAVLLSNLPPPLFSLPRGVAAVFNMHALGVRHTCMQDMLGDEFAEIPETGRCTSVSGVIVDDGVQQLRHHFSSLCAVPVLCM